MMSIRNGIVFFAFLAIVPIGAIADEAGRAKEMETISFLLTLKDYDTQCHVLDVKGRKRFIAFGAMMINNAEVSEAARAYLAGELGNENSKTTLDCTKRPSMFRDGLMSFDKMLVDGAFPAGRDGAASRADEVPTANATPDSPSPGSDAEDGFIAAKRALADMPKGRLTRFAGCYSARTPDWSAQLCLKDGGDRVTIVFRDAKSSATCTIDDGDVRSREDGFYFAATTATRKCSDGSRFTHVEGLCSGEKATISCLMTAFDIRNTMYYFKGERLVNGELKLKRK